MAANTNRRGFLKRIFGGIAATTVAPFLPKVLTPIIARPTLTVDRLSAPVLSVLQMHRVVEMQRMANYSYSAAIELLALAPKAPYINGR